MARARKPRHQNKKNSTKVRMPSVPRFDDKTGWRQQDELREEVLDHIQESVPQVLEELYQLRDLYCQLPEKEQKMGRVSMGSGTWNLGSVPRAWTWDELIKSTAAGEPTAAALTSQLSTWIQKWFKDDPHWLMLRAIETLHSWKKLQQDRKRITEWQDEHDRLAAQPNMADRVAQLKSQICILSKSMEQAASLSWSLDSPFPSATFHSSTLEEPVEFVFKHPGWRFEGEDRKAWLAELDAAFTLAKNSYVTAIVENTSSMVAPKLVPMPIPRSSGWHVAAFIRYQIQGISKRELAAQYPPDVDRENEDFDIETSINTIYKAVTVVASKFDVKLRSEPAGRPAGSTNIAH